MTGLSFCPTQAAMVLALPWRLSWLTAVTAAARRISLSRLVQRSPITHARQPAGGFTLQWIVVPVSRTLSGSSRQSKLYLCTVHAASDRQQLQLSQCCKLTFTLNASWKMAGGLLHVDSTQPAFERGNCGQNSAYYTRDFMVILSSPSHIANVMISKISFLIFHVWVEESSHSRPYKTLKTFLN